MKVEKGQGGIMGGLPYKEIVPDCPLHNAPMIGGEAPVYDAARPGSEHPFASVYVWRCAYGCDIEYLIAFGYRNRGGLLETRKCNLHKDIAMVFQHGSDQYVCPVESCTETATR